MKYYKMVYGFGPMDYISIDEMELEKALYVHLTGKTALFKEGSISGKNITMVVPDYNKMAGWNAGYKPNQDDLADIRKMDLVMKPKDFLGETHAKVQRLMETGKVGLIGKNVDIKEIE